MIYEVADAKEMLCPLNNGQDFPQKNSERTCLGPDCMMWHFWVPPPGICGREASSLTTEHGKPDTLKKGYCGLSGTY